MIIMWIASAYVAVGLVYFAICEAQGLELGTGWGRVVSVAAVVLLWPIDVVVGLLSRNVS